jgi:hypothetical protein
MGFGMQCQWSWMVTTLLPSLKLLFCCCLGGGCWFANVKLQQTIENRTSKSQDHLTPSRHEITHGYKRGLAILV